MHSVPLGILNFDCKGNLLLCHYRCFAFANLFPAWLNMSHSEGNAAETLASCSSCSPPPTSDDLFYAYFAITSLDLSCLLRTGFNRQPCSNSHCIQSSPQLPYPSLSDCVTQRRLPKLKGKESRLVLGIYHSNRFSTRQRCSEADAGPAPCESLR